uniref:Ornithine decarboxylase n=1 Tax=Parascaris univalens TaxID=6257 RepID=A0A915C3B4_PARUN
MAHVLSRVPCDALSKARRYDVTSYQNRLPSIRSELFANTPITVFGDEREALSVARDLAEMKTAQGDNYPFYVMDMGRLENLLNAWREHMPRVQPFYSLRCNADPVLLRLLVEQPDVGFCCTNRVELNMAVELAGRERVLYANPLWTRGSVRHAREMGVELLLFESREDLLRMHAAYPEASLVLRVCMNAPVSEGTMHVGCELMGEAPELLSMAADLGVKIVGISFSIGAGACSLGIYAYAIAQACRLFGVAASLGHDLCVLDIGGGFPCGSLTRGPSFSQVAAAISASLDEYFPESSFSHVRIIAEPGRYFAASVFSLITNIIDKRAVDASVVTNDVFDSGTAGFVYQTNEGFFGSFGCRLTAFCEPKCRPLVECVHDVSADHYTYATILGPTLSSNVDIVQPVARLPQMQIGEWLLWDDMGAYSMGNLETLGEDGQPSPTIYYFVDDERWQHMSRPSTPERVADVDGSSHKREGTEVEVDSHSMESMESESAVTDDEPYWPNLEQWLTD